MSKLSRPQKGPNAIPKAGSQPVTLGMVALAAGVSPSTVSRILNGTAVVNDLKKKAVDDAIARLGFVPNPIARGLAGGRTLSVGVITQTIDSPFYGPALRGIEDVLDPAGYSPLFVSGHWKTETEARCIEVLRSRRVDGIILLTGRLTDQALRAHAKTLPMVVTGRQLKAPGLVSLNFDNFEGGRMATQHLIDQGHKRIAFICGDPEQSDATERLRGYRAALEASKLPFVPSLVVPGGFQEYRGQDAVEHLTKTRQRYTAIFSANDQMAIGVVLALNRLGLQVPRDVSLIGFDDLPIAPFVMPPLSTVHQPAYELGQLAASAMLQLLAGTKPVIAMPAPHLVVRDSTRNIKP